MYAVGCRRVPARRGFQLHRLARVQHPAVPVWCVCEGRRASVCTSAHISPCCFLHTRLCIAGEHLFGAVLVPPARRHLLTHPSLPPPPSPFRLLSDSGVAPTGESAADHEIIRAKMKKKKTGQDGKGTPKGKGAGGKGGGVTKWVRSGHN